MQGKHGRKLEPFLLASNEEMIFIKGSFQGMISLAVAVEKEWLVAEDLAEFEVSLTLCLHHPNRQNTNLNLFYTIHLFLYLQGRE